MKKFILITIFLLIGLVLFAAAIEKMDLQQILLIMSHLSLSEFLILLLVFFLAIIVGLFRWALILKGQSNLKPPFSKVFIAKIVGASINYLTPVCFAGGEPFKAYILKEEAKIPWDKTISSIVISEALHLSAILFFIVAGVFSLIISQVTLSLPIVLVLIGAVIFCLGIFYLFYSKTLNKKNREKGFFTSLIDVLGLDKFKTINNYKGKIVKTEEKISYFFKTKKSDLAGAIILSFIEVILTIFANWLAILFLGIRLDLKEILSVFGVMNLSFLFPIPAALGVFEFSQSFVFDILNLGAINGVAFSLINRLVMIIVAGLGILFLIHFEIKILSTKISDKLPKIIKKLKEIFGLVRLE
jgi:uncharacterized protein (TIRG00374 family)